MPFTLGEASRKDGGGCQLWSIASESEESMRCFGGGPSAQFKEYGIQFQGLDLNKIQFRTKVPNQPYCAGK